MHSWDSQDWQATIMRKAIIVECAELNLSQSYEIDIPYYAHQRELDLGHSLHHILNDIMHYTTELQIFYFHPRKQLFEYAGIYPFKYPLLIGEDFTTELQITVRFRPLLVEAEHSQPQTKAGMEEKEKKKRVPQRNIRQVLQKVSQWRQLSQQNPKINLEEGAKIIGIPKKTLDDYYAHIKLGTEYNFDFQQNLNQKIGVLRSFVREKNLKKRQNLLLKQDEVDGDDFEEEQE